MYSEQECRESLPQISLLVHIHTDMRVYEAKLTCQFQMFVGLYSGLCSVDAKLYSMFKGLVLLLFMFKNTEVTTSITVIKTQQRMF